jgi:NAD(P)-dependent dehydrogenase (short-subunit alcohol dehydrogenase family)
VETSISLDFKLNDMFALVTGGGKGIGKQIALAYARLGADIVVCGRHLESQEKTAKEIQQEGHRSLPVRADVRFVLIHSPS